MVNEYNPVLSGKEMDDWFDNLQSYLWFRCRLEFDIVGYRIRKHRNKKWYQRKYK